ncbi:GNAT family N-acetyltransferase [Ileibacterium valens]|uniref:GNAT family N-acetyltransferase n=1 Tax=Ileibacterium valens TaxID=1862668 RepID=UPI002729A96E|nr:GNAT family N-acetyltransferase [Ileibacterium valens]
MNTNLESGQKEKQADCSFKSCFIDGIREFKIQDLDEVYEIYCYYVDHSNYNLDLTPESKETFLNSIVSNPDFPFLVAEYDGKIIGYGTAHHYRPKAGYQHTAELTIYFEPSNHHGLSHALADTLTNILRMQNVRQEIGCITASNKPSIAMGLRRGFKEYGRLKDAAIKAGEFCDVVWMSRVIQNGDAQKASDLKDFIPYSVLKSYSGKTLN